jgi:hypothetical protein
MTDYFFSLPGFVRGAGRTLDLGGGLHKGSYLISESPAEADARAIASDWATVDHDLTVATSRLADEQEEAK